ncbi:hypothetical protein [Micromonospora radicis]|uniref:GNAT family N-acetyltransferase n=1 Tax=Micromonospora radicis TaxID=1894971 RepID=A0A418MNY9_9ACTN|nr:hypothetical protein [Micromonospora radicis]RIV33205.1 hypothetical protein D2L64_23985 [Micromonospora radicis]
MTPTDVRSILDHHDPAQVEHYERTFYTAYAGLADNRLVRLIWDFDHDRRLLRTRVPYRDQIIYQWAAAGAAMPGCYLAVNIDPRGRFQSARFGFAPEPLDLDHCCELLNLMTPAPLPEAAGLFRRLLDEFVAPDLRSRGFAVAYATCTRRLVQPYLRLGARRVHHVSLHGEERHLIRLSLDRPAPGPQTSSSSTRPDGVPAARHIMR